MESGEELAFHIPPSLCALCLKGSRAASFCFPLCHEHNSSIHFKIYIWKKICIYCTDSPGFSSLMFACIQGFAVPSNHRCFLFCSLTCPVLGFSSGIVSFTVMCTLSRGKMPEKRFPHFLIISFVIATRHIILVRLGYTAAFTLHLWNIHQILKTRCIEMWGWIFFLISIWNSALGRSLDFVHLDSLIFSWQSLDPNAFNMFFTWAFTATFASQKSYER